MNTRLDTGLYLPNVIGLYSPVPGCGKDTIAAHLENYGYVNIKMAGALKKMAAVLYTEMGYGENELHELLEGPNRNLIEIFPAEVRQELSECGLLVDVVTPAVTARSVLETLGTDWGRIKVRPNLWTCIAARKIERALRAGLRVVVTDLRAPNEYELLKVYIGTRFLRVTRDAAPNAGSHWINGKLNDHHFHRNIANNGTIADLQAEVDKTLGLLQ